MPRLKIWNSALSEWRYVDNPTNITASVSCSYALTASYALNGGSGGSLNTGSSYPITASWSTNSVTSSYFNEVSASLITGSLYLRSNSGSLWKITVFEDGDHVGTIQLEGPY
jgi:hypothetical protein